MNLRPVIMAFAAVALVACGSSTGGSDSDAGGGGGGGGGGGACTTADQCGGGQVCDPTTSTCANDVGCTSHADCGNAAYCTDQGTCAPAETGSACDSNDNCTGGETCTGGFCGCGGENFTAENVPPNVLIVLDRSGSMNNNLPSGVSKWDTAQAAITELVANYGDQIRFGLSLYPGTNQSCSQGAKCTAGTTFIDPGVSNGADITSFLAGANTCSFGTPTGEMLNSLIGYSGLADTSRPDYILLVTDGQSTCNDPVAEVGSLLGQTPGVKTFVVGFGSGVDANELNAMAVAGDTAIAGGPPSYYQADDAASLASAFATIAGSVLSCSYTLSGTPADVDKLFVYFDSVGVDRDPTDTTGWDYDPATNQVTFHGASCDALQGGTVGDLVIVYGCPLTSVE